MKKLFVSQFHPANDEISKIIAVHVDKVAKASGTGIDLLFAAFIEETGLPVSKIEMVQENTATGTVIYFRARRGRTKKPIEPLKK
jgi:hypothetical protein